mmetsp:Transcript_69775/g.149329  ORF Transcript_69775/g.149329 Transcript_69775/m.149329 type:complete len:332 (-) Transcript_69775:29-1024(-)
MLDVLLVLSALYDWIYSAITPSVDNQNMSSLRVMRLLKMIKIIRVVRVMKMFRELRLLMRGILGAMRPMFWAALLLLIITYMCGVCFLQASTYHLVADPDVTAETRTDIEEYWSSVTTCMLSLYMSSTDGISWIHVAKPLKAIGSFYHILFLIYIAFYTFVVVNTITSLFIEATMASAEKDTNSIIQEELTRKKMYIEKLHRLWLRCDVQDSGELSLQDFMELMQDPELLAFASSLELEMIDLEMFFLMLSSDGKEPVDFTAFVSGCMKYKGPARSMDVQALMAFHDRMSKDMRQFQKYCVKQFGLILGNRPGPSTLMTEPNGHQRWDVEI